MAIRIPSEQPEQAQPQLSVSQMKQAAREEYARRQGLAPTVSDEELRSVSAEATQQGPAVGSALPTSRTAPTPTSGSPFLSDPSSDPTTYNYTPLEYTRRYAYSADPFREQPLVVGQAQPGAVESARRAAGLPSMSGGGAPPGLSQSQQQVLASGMKFGLTRREVYEEIQAAKAAGLVSGPMSGEDWDALLYERLAPGYQQAKEAMAGPGGFVSEAAWATLPAQRQFRMMHARPVSSFEKDRYKQPIIPQGWIRRGSESHAFPMEAITHASALGVDPQGRTISTFDPSKIEKRIQTLGAHETVQMTGLRSAPAFMREGRLSPGPEDLRQVMRGALIIGGNIGGVSYGSDVGGPGTVYIDPSVGRATQRVYKELEPTAGRYTGVAIRGASFEPGSEIALATGVSPERTGKWRYSVEDVAGLEGGGIAFTMTQSASPEQSRIALKSGGTKLQAYIRSLGDVTGAGGEGLGLQFMGGMKDVQGAVYEWYRGQGMGALTQDIAAHGRAMPGGERRTRSLAAVERWMGGRSYQELGDLPMQAWMSQQAQASIQTVHVPEVLTAAHLERYQKAGSVVGDSIEISPGIFRATLQHQAIVGDFGKLISHEYPYKRPFLSAAELESMRAVNPAEAQRLWEEGAEMRSTYRDVARAAAASTGRFQAPVGTITAEAAGIPGLVSAASTAARAATGLGETEDVPRPVLAHHMMRILAESSAGESPIEFQGPTGQKLVLPPAQSMLRFGTSGTMEGEEGTKYLRRATDLMQAYAAQDPTRYGPALMAAREAQRELVSGKDFMRATEGAFLRRGTAMGDVLHMSQALHPQEVYLPNEQLAGQAVRSIRFPSAGSEMYDPNLALRALSRSEAKERGLNLQLPAFSPEMIQMLRGDTDGDKFLALAAGDATVDDRGNVVGKDGQRLGNVDAIMNGVNRALTQGAGNVMSEMSGATGALSKAGALQIVQESIQGASHSTSLELEQGIRQGSHLRGLIGQYFNVFSGERGNVRPEELETFETLFNISHGFAQRPARQLPGMAAFHSLAKASLVSETTGKPIAGAWSPELGEFRNFQYASGVGGARGLQMEALGVFASAESALPLTGQQFAQAMGGGAGMETAYEQYRRGKEIGGPRGSVIQAEAMNMMLREAGSPEEWGQRSLVGRLLLPRATARAVGKLENLGLSSPQIAERLGMSEEGLSGLLSVNRSQQQRLEAVRRKGVDEAGLLSKIEAMQASGFGEWFTEREGVAPRPGSLVERVLTGPRAVPKPSAAEIVPDTVTGAEMRGGAPPSFHAARALTGQDPLAMKDVRPMAGGGGAGSGPPPPPAPPSAAEPPEWPGQPPAAETQAQQMLRAGRDLSRAIGGGFRMGVSESGQGWVRFGGSRSIDKLTEEVASSLQSLKPRLDAWEKSIGPVIKANEDLDKEQQKVTKALGKEYGKLDEMERAARTGGRMDLVEAIQAARGTAGGAMIGPAQGYVREQEDWAPFGGVPGRGGRPPSRWEQMGLVPKGGWRAGLGSAGRDIFSGWEMMRLRRMWGMTGGYAMGQIPVAAQEEMAATQAAAIGMPMGMYQPGDMAMNMMGIQARQNQMQVNVGRGAAAAWGWLPGLMAQPGVGTALGVGLPGLGLGLSAYWGASALGLGAAGPIGITTGLVAAAIGGYNYLRSQATDEPLQAYQMAQRLQDFDPELVDAFLKTQAGRVYLGTGEQDRVGQQMLTGNLRGLPMAYRVRTIQEAYQYAPQWMTQESAEQAAAQWMRYTPGAENIKDIYQDPRFEAMAMRGFSPEQFARQVQGMGMGPERWQEMMDLTLRVSEPRAMSMQYTAGQWDFLRGYGMDPMEIQNRAAPPGQAQTLYTAANALSGIPLLDKVSEKLNEAADKSTEASDVPLERLDSLTRTRGEQLGGMMERLRLMGFEVPEAPLTPQEINQQYLDMPTWQARAGLQQQFVGMGANMPAATAAAQQLGSAGDVNMFQRFMGGDKFVMSMLGQRNVQGLFGTDVSLGGGVGIDMNQMRQQWEGVLQPLMGAQEFDHIRQLMGQIRPTVDVQTGMPMGQTRMWKGFYQDWQREIGIGPGSVPGFETDLRSVDDRMAGRIGQVAEQQGIRGLNALQQTWQQQYQDFQVAQRESALQWSEVQQFGGEFRGFETRGTFAIERELRNLSRIWEDFSQEFSQQQREVQYKQFMENWQVRSERLPVQFEWQRSDLAFQGQQQTLQFGWQMEDLQENLRFATGRDRRRLLRQQERASIQYGMGMGRLEEMGGRIDTREQWAREDLDREKRQFEERWKLQEEYQEQYKRYMEERRGLEDELQKIREFNARFQLEQSKAELDMSKELQERQREIEKQHRAITELLEQETAKINQITQLIQLFITAFSGQGAVAKAWTQMADHAESEIYRIQDAFSSLHVNVGRGGRR